MSGLLGSLHTAYSGMSAHQVAIQTTNQNITNMNNSSYTRQRAEISARLKYGHPGFNTPIGVEQSGLGVEVSSITRIRNSFLDYQFRSESHSYGSTAVKYEYFSNIENIYKEPSENAISATLNDFYNSCNELSKDPDSIGAKNIFLQGAKEISTNLTQTLKQLENLKETAGLQQSNILSEINSMLKNIKQLDEKIKITEAVGKPANDLLDAKDAMIDELSFKLNLQNEDVQAVIADGELTEDELVGIDFSGELQGIIDMTKEIENQQNNVKTIMTELFESVNEVYNKGLNTWETGDIFVLGQDKNGLMTIEVSEEFVKDPSKLKMTAEKAVELYGLKSEKRNIGGKDLTVTEFYHNSIQDLGTQIQRIKRDEKNQSSLLNSIDSSRMSTSGVNLDEEMVNLIQFQHAYNASAKLVSTIDSLLDVVINGLIR